MSSPLSCFVSTAVLAALALPLAEVEAGPPPVEVTTCGQQVPGRRTGYLSADLTCTTELFAVRLGPGATLDLRGFTLAGGLTGVACMPTACVPPTCGTRSPCEVRNGMITETRNAAISGGRVTVRNLMVDGYGGVGVDGWPRIAVFDSQFLNATGGVVARRVEVTGSTLINTPVNAERVWLTSSSVVDNDRVGVSAYAATLIDSTVTNNGLSSECGSLWCADIATDRRPRLDATSMCGTSLAMTLSPYEPWGVCTLDP